MDRVRRINLPLRYPTKECPLEIAKSRSKFDFRIKKVHQHTPNNMPTKKELQEQIVELRQWQAGQMNFIAGINIDLEKEITKLKAENERLTKKSDSSDEYIDILQGRCYRINNQYCRWKHQKKRLPWDRMISMEEIDERLKMDDNIDLTLAPLFKIMKHFMEENEQLKAENEQLKAD